MDFEHYVSGVVRPKQSYERLLSWNEKLPLVGYGYGKTSHEIRWRKRTPTSAIEGSWITCVALTGVILFLIYLLKPAVSS